MADIDFTQDLAAAKETFATISDAVNPDKLRAQAADLEQQAAAPGLWDDPDHAQEVTSKLSSTQTMLKRIDSMKTRIDDVETLESLGEEMMDADTIAEAKREAALILSGAKQHNSLQDLEDEKAELEAEIDMLKAAARDYRNRFLRLVEDQQHVLNSEKALFDEN